MVLDNSGSGKGQLVRGVDSVDDQVTVNISPEQAAGILSGDPKFQNLKEQIIEERSRRLAPAGSMHLPELLDKRRLEYAIPNDVFELGAAFDKVLVFQVSEEEKETVGDTGIIMSDVTKERMLKESPMGVICDAGLEARDILLGNGMDVGHLVAIVKLAPFRKEAGTTHGHRHEVMILRVGDIIGSVDLARAKLRGDVRVVWDPDAGESGMHRYIVRNPETGKFDLSCSYDPLSPEMASEV